MFPEGLVCRRCQRKQPGPLWTGVLLAHLLFLCWGLRAGGGQDSSGISAGAASAEVPTNSDALATPQLFLAL